MISFSKFFKILIESSSQLNKVAREDLHMTNSLDEIPPKAPYGFWVDRSGNFKPTGFYQHHTDAVQMIELANDHLHAQGEPIINYSPRSKQDPYRVLFENGWIRVILPGTDVYYQGYPGELPTNSQVKFLKRIKQAYDKSTIKRETHRDLK